MQKFNSKFKSLENLKFLLLAYIFAFYLLPFDFLSASNVYLETSRSEFFVGDTILVEVKVDSEGREINTVEGQVFLDYLPEVASIKDISLSESSFSLWPTKPLPSEDLRTISFVGGVPSGLKSPDATLFKIVLNLKSPGQVSLGPTGVSVYLNDGKGTKDVVNVENLTLSVLSPETGYQPLNELSALISGDKTPPAPFEIALGQDSSVFEGKKFLSFVTVDEQSGIKYYEVREGDLPPVRSNGTYILQNQDKGTRVVVIAYDAAGNARESVYEPGRSYTNLILITVLVLIVLSVLYRLIIKRRRNAITKS